MSIDAQTRARWEQCLQGEIDSAYLYRQLADMESVPKRRETLLRIAGMEDNHQEMWREIFRKNSLPIPAARPSGHARLQVLAARYFGSGFLLARMLAQEGREVKSYLKLHRSSGDESARLASMTLAQESAEHAGHLRDLTGASGEPWHRAESGGFLRNVVYGFNDGLTANFGLVAGVLGANVAHEVVLLSGLAGAMADALSMGSSGYLAAKSEREVYEHEIELEREEIRMMPEAEEDELALIYEAKGIDPVKAREMARVVMSDPETALAEKVREELDITAAHSTPIREAWVTGVATLVGAAIPVAPFLVLEGAWAIWTSFTIAMLSHFAVGAARSIFTGRGVLRSGIDMFLVGLGVAIVGYFVGDGFTRWYAG
ncbi:VIT1/CCC1 transporter family protein [bacterium]|nr:VIT1/CCC1 transporter family protein [bacterium]